MRTIIVTAVLPVKRTPLAKEVPPDQAPRRIPSEELLGRAGQAVIVHNCREYRLRKTQNGKLILTA
ncbi:MAG: hemin uptake protein HemP [Betaproteobacteria bacterium]